MASDPGGTSRSSSPFSPALSVLRREKEGKCVIDVPKSYPVLGNGDPRYKKYASGVERCLSIFEARQEWADYISFLARLLKVICSSGK